MYVFISRLACYIYVVILLSLYRKYNDLFFPGSNFTYGGVIDLVERLAHNSVQIETKGKLNITCPALTWPQQRELIDFTKEKLNCGLQW